VPLLQVPPATLLLFLLLGWVAAGWSDLLGWVAAGRSDLLDGDLQCSRNLSLLSLPLQQLLPLQELPAAAVALEVGSCRHCNACILHIHSNTLVEQAKLSDKQICSSCATDDR
jgi:hypothetical protein